MFNVRLAFQLRAMWGDPRRLAEFADRLIGGTLRHWDEMRVRSGREMAQALMPMWEHEIHHFMERMEYEDRNRGYRGMRHDAMYFDDFGPTPWGQPEDPKAKQKARDLLLRNLDDGQAKSFKKDGEFRVTGKDGKAYTIKTARSFNVVGPDGAKYCGQLVDTPIEDQMLRRQVRTGITYRTYLPGVVAELEEREAALFCGYPLPEWRDLPWQERARSVAHYRVQHLIRLHADEASTMAAEMRSRARRS